MVLNTISGAHVCLRCQLRLSIHSLPTASILPAKSQLRRGVRLQHNETRPEEPNALPRQADAAGTWQLREVQLESSAIREGKIDGTGPEEVGQGREMSHFWRPLKPHLSARPLGRLHGFRGHKLREKGVHLNMEALGTPAEVIVLRDAGVKFNAPSQIEDLQVEEKVDILARVNAERGLIGQAEVEKNVEELKPKSPLVAWKELQMVQRQLVAGFTSLQLKRYAESLESRQQLDITGTQTGAYKDIIGTIISKTRWVPGVSAVGGDFVADYLRGYDSEAFTDKQRLVMRILRQYWELEAMEIAESTGELELEIGNVALDLLTKGRVSPLRALSDKLIATREENIEASRSRNVIRITAAKEKADIIAQNIEDVLSRFEHDQVILDVLDSTKNSPKGQTGDRYDDLYDNSVVNELAQITETHITRLSRDKLAVSCIDLKKPESHLSSRIDIVRRLLLTSSRIADQTKLQLGCHDDLESLITIKYHMKDGMSWRNRMRSWGRWTTARAKPLDSIEESIQSTEYREDMVEQNAVFPGNTLFKPMEELAIPKALSRSKTTCLSCISTSAVIGHVLHEVPDGVEVATDPLNYLVSQHTVFQPASINLSRVLGPRQRDGPHTTELVMRFIPSPWSAAGPNVFSQFPPIEMHFKVDRETKNPKLRDVTALIDSTASDVMLPNASLDLRFQQRTTVQLYPSYETVPPQVKSFLQHSQLNVMRGRLETPPSLTMPVADWLNQIGVSENSRTGHGEPFDLEYLFVGLEYRNYLAHEFDGWRLLYTSIEGGKADGRRSELSLKPWRTDNTTKKTEHMSLVSQEKQAQDFIKAAYSLVQTLENTTVPTRQPMISPSSIMKISSGKKELQDDFTYFKRRIDFTEGSTRQSEY